MEYQIQIDKETKLVIPTLDYAKQIFEVIDNDREYLSKWLSWVEYVRSEHDVWKNIFERIELFRNEKAASFYGVYKNEFVASVGFISIDNKNKKGEIGYWLSSKFQGKGLMTKFVKACIEYGFEELELNRIVIKCASKNQKSAGVAKRLGFTLEGTLRQERRSYGVFYDTQVYSLLKSEY